MNCKDAGECHYGDNGECALPIAGEGCFKEKQQSPQTDEAVVRLNDLLNAKPLNWIATSTGEMPEISKDVLGMDSESGICEFGFRSKIDNHESNWADFHFAVTHWAYANFPSGI